MYMATKIRSQLKSKSKKLDHYAGEWVAFIGEKVVAHHRALARTMAEVEQKGFAKSKVSVFLVPRKDEGPYALLVV